MFYKLAENLLNDAIEDSEESGSYHMIWQKIAAAFVFAVLAIAESISKENNQ